MLGRLGDRSSDYGVPGGGNRLTREEQLTCATLWYIMRSPLMISCNLETIDDWTLGLLTNAEAVEIVKSSRGNRELFRRDDLAAWTAEGRDCRYLALFNLNDGERLVGTSLSELGLEGRWALRDIWGKHDLDTTDSQIEFRLPAHGSRLLRLTFSRHARNLSPGRGTEHARLEEQVPRPRHRGHHERLPLVFTPQSSDLRYRCQEARSAGLVRFDLPPVCRVGRRLH
jgi:hypothetical protein